MAPNSCSAFCIIAFTAASSAIFDSVDRMENASTRSVFTGCLKRYTMLYPVTVLAGTEFCPVTLPNSDFLAGGQVPSFSTYPNFNPSSTPVFILCQTGLVAFDLLISSSKLSAQIFLLKPVKTSQPFNGYTFSSQYLSFSLS